ncbi:MAG: glycosyltransferase [Balneolaceae bacterium]
MQPPVSVIIPVLNVASTIEAVLQALEKQTYPPDRVEMIVVDNGSVDQTRKIIERYPVTLLEETNVKNPYAARNKGLKAADGKILALTDGNKIPAVDWLEKGVRCLMKSKYDLVGGRVEFQFSEHRSLGEIFDSITFLDNEKYVNEEQASLGGNLFFHRKVLDTMGDFPVDIRTGMDIYWSRKAVDAGFKIGYCPESTVYSVARTWGSTLRKSYRVGMGHPLTMQAAGKNRPAILYHILRTFLPPSPLNLYRRIKKRGENRTLFYFPVLWLMDYGKKLAMAAGRLAGLKNLKPGGNDF